MTESGAVNGLKYIVSRSILKLPDQRAIAERTPQCLSCLTSHTDMPPLAG